EGRFNFHYLHDPKRVTEPTGGSWEGAISKLRSFVGGKKKLAVLVGSDLPQEELKLIQEFVPKHAAGATISHFGTPGIKSAADDGDADRILKRKSKTSNLHGA